MAASRSSLQITDLQNALSAADPAALLTNSRLLRRIIKHDCALPGVGFQVPHRKSYVIARDSLLRIVAPQELHISSQAETLILLASPRPVKLRALNPAAVLAGHWRLLFHAHVHIAMEKRLANSADAPIRERLQRIGRAEFDEIEAVLRQENYLLPPGDPRSIYIEFAAVYLELRYFACPLLTQYFPTIQQFETIDQTLAEDIDADRIFAGTRLEGASEPGASVWNGRATSLAATSRTALDSATAGPALVVPRSNRANESRFQRSVRSAEKAGTVGNVVRAAIFRTRAASFAPPELMIGAMTAAAGDIGQLAARLHRTLGSSADELATWENVLPMLLPPAVVGFWQPEARFLYDLQKVCIDYEREVYSLNLLGWIFSLGKRSLRKPLPYEREVLMLKHLRSAARRLPSARIEAPERQRLAALLRNALRRVEERIRDNLHPLLESILEEVGPRPGNHVEHIARNKLIEELLDRITEHGFLTMGDLRDALSRNQLKLSDLAGTREFVHGDCLLKLDRRLGKVIDGTYRSGEIYLRFLQRLSALAFGTRPGRLLAGYVVLPFGGSFVGLEGLKHVIGPVAVATTGHEIEIVTPVSVGLTGCFVLALLYQPAFRHWVTSGLRLAWKCVRFFVLDCPAYLLHLSLVQKVLASAPVEIFRRYALRPLLLTALFSSGLPWTVLSAVQSFWAAAVFFVAAALFLNSGFGRNLEEALIDWVVRRWDRVRIDILPGLFRLVMSACKRVVEDIERCLYTVDEWLRFRTGESRLTLATKAALGSLWFLVTYLVRIYINLLIEPTINPIKHFPVVTVAAKILLPFSIVLTNLLAAPFSFLGTFVANTLAGTTVILLPGVCGFLVWELKENRRLYRANRSATLEKVVIGHHGETMIRLLRPGFHSGTLPKLYAKLRRAERKARRTGNRKACVKQRDAIQHVEESVRRFVEREMLMLLNESGSWRRPLLESGEIQLGSKRLRIEICRPALSEDGLWITFEEQAGWLVVGIDRPGWLSSLEGGQARAFTAALAGLYKKAGVDLVREQIETAFKGLKISYEINSQGVVIRSEDGVEAETAYELGDQAIILPRSLTGPCPATLPPLNSSALSFAGVSIDWNKWVDIWERDQIDDASLKELLGGAQLLPDTSPTR